MFTALLPVHQAQMKIWGIKVWSLLEGPVP